MKQKIQMMNLAQYDLYYELFIFYKYEEESVLCELFECLHAKIQAFLHKQISFLTDRQTDAINGFKLCRKPLKSNFH